MTIGQRIKNRRLELGLSVEFVAEKLNKNRATIYRYESDDIENLPTTILEPLADILQTTPAFLMGWEDNRDEYTEKIIDHGTFKERIITDSNGNVVDIMQELNSISEEKKPWVGTAFRAAKELSEDELRHLEHYANLLLKEVQDKKNKRA
jgi:Uncharacterized protein conserved in bacteria